MVAERGVISYPIPPFQNMPIEAQFYLPSQFEIEEITRGLTTTVETTEPHNYVIGQNVRLIIPPSYGIRQLNGTESMIIDIPTTKTVVVNIDSRFMDPYVDGNSNIQVAQIIPIGDFNTGQINASGRINQSLNIPGSFENIS